MESAALILFFSSRALFVSSMSVLFGWQPMPGGETQDGRPLVEYIVQLEPELVATMHEGQSIPITSDIPSDIGPIGRIRIVVGSDQLPRQTLATQFKPWPQQTLPETSFSEKLASESSLPAKRIGEGVLETQYRVEPVEPSGAGRYGIQAASDNAILPPSDNGAATVNPFGRVQQQGVQEAQNLAAEVKQQILPPPAEQLFGAGSGASQSVQGAIDNTTSQLRQSFERGVQQAGDQAGQRFQRELDNVGRRARETVGQLERRADSSERSVLTTSQNQSSATILPPNSPPQGQANSGPTASKGQRIDEPLQQRQLDPWTSGSSGPPANFSADASTRQTNPSSQPGGVDPSWPATTSILPADTRVSDPPLSRYGGQSIQPRLSAPNWPSDSTGRDPFDVANRQNENPSARYADNRQPGYHSTNGNPTSVNSTAGNQTVGGLPDLQLSSAGPQQPPPQNVDTHWPAQSTIPAITRDMLEPPVSGNVQTASSSNDGTKPDESKTLFPLLLSWVLLSGSGAGNAYLWWSYLDVRNKYHGVVHGSPARRGRYDD